MAWDVGFHCDRLFGSDVVIDINAELHPDGRKIVRCKTKKAVEAAIAAGAIAHLISGSVSIEIKTGTAMMWSSGNSTATMESSDNSTATMWSSDNSTATMRSYGNSTATMAWLSDKAPDQKTALRLNYTIPEKNVADANIREVAPFVKNERQCFDMATWHSQDLNDDGVFPCGTTHCMAGAAVFLKGEEGRKLETLFGTGQAGALILGAEAAKLFNVDNKTALKFLSEKFGEEIQ
jgi:hypothetical protein